MKVGISITQNNTSIILLESIREFLSYGNIWFQCLKASAFGISSLKNTNLFIDKLNAENITKDLNLYIIQISVYVLV